VILDVRPTGDVEFMTRSNAGEATTYLTGTTVTTPVWLKLIRSGDVVTASVSSDGTTWTIVGSTTTGVSSDYMQIGIVVTSHDRGSLNTSTFDHVEVRIPY
jgi:regulation of enolase protein 1 (concanavalin A-like superfamily)